MLMYTSSSYADVHKLLTKDNLFASNWTLLTNHADIFINIWKSETLQSGSVRV